MLKATAIPYKSFKERMRIQEQEEKKGRKIHYDKEFVYSYLKENGTRDYKNLKCNDCGLAFRITTTRDIQYAVCPQCGTNSLDYLLGWEEKVFQKQIG